MTVPARRSGAVAELFIVSSSSPAMSCGDQDRQAKVGRAGGSSGSQAAAISARGAGLRECLPHPRLSLLPLHFAADQLSNGRHGPLVLVQAADRYPNLRPHRSTIPGSASDRPCPQKTHRWLLVAQLRSIAVESPVIARKNSAANSLLWRWSRRRAWEISSIGFHVMW